MNFLLPLFVFLAVAVTASYGAAAGGNIYSIWHPYRLPRTATSAPALTAFRQRNDLQMTNPTKAQVNAFFDRLHASVRAELEQCYRKMS
ncbi:hypothetical protein PRIPAC_76569 [Pristionchus pacificus]|uniref:Uncharacterized protein n=1 Tax=Pristionchus pacificus TaxID=54126 RepID=A0A2A6C0Z9_PRIPA|nr:hypothetical protein PRIPAC_76569 [Pristionchus pacificus]|eukprot:PDM71777.1 hypothetical protein PRIPAC_38184 [Pristionchus pacificus]